MAYGAGSLADARIVEVAKCGVCESASAIGRGTKWSVGGEAVWCVWAAGLWNGASARPLAGLTAERKRPDVKGRQTASPP